MTPTTWPLANERAREYRYTFQLNSTTWRTVIGQLATADTDAYNEEIRVASGNAGVWLAGASDEVSRDFSLRKRDFEWLSWPVTKGRFYGEGQLSYSYQNFNDSFTATRAGAVSMLPDGKW